MRKTPIAFQPAGYRRAMTRTQPPPGFTLPRVLSSQPSSTATPQTSNWKSSTNSSRSSPTRATPSSTSAMCGLNFDELATLLESERVDKAYRAMCRILAIRQKFIDAQSHFVTTAQLLSIASAQPMDAKEADQSRKAANKLHALTTLGAEGVPPSVPAPGSHWDGLPARLSTKPDGLEARPTTGQPRPASPGEWTSQGQDTPSPNSTPRAGRAHPAMHHHEHEKCPTPSVAPGTRNARGIRRGNQVGGGGGFWSIAGAGLVDLGCG
jgi:hypothetical protein